MPLLAAGLMHAAPALAALLFLAGLGVMARASVADEEAFLGWRFLVAIAGVVGAAVGSGGDLTVGRLREGPRVRCAGPRNRTPR